MSDSIYYCTQLNNTCVKKEECKRYVECENHNHATLFKAACTENNSYLLFIKCDKEKENNGEQSQAS